MKEKELDWSNPAWLALESFELAGTTNCCWQAHPKGRIQRTSTSQKGKRI